MTKIAPGGDHISDASQQPAQQMVQAAKIQKKETVANDASQAASGSSRMKFAAQKIIHTPETPADYAKRVGQDRELKNIKKLEDGI